MADEQVEALDNAGKPLFDSVSRAEAHRRGIWHRAVSVFVLNQYGEILFEKRSVHKDLFPGLYDIPGGHLAPGQRPADGAREELKQEVGLDVSGMRLVSLSAEDALVERLVIPEKAIINLERKTAYLVEISESEEQAILCKASEWVHLPAQELEDRGAEGEVSHVEFWSWERVQDALRNKDRRILASGTETALSDYGVQRQVLERCLGLRASRQRRFSESNRSVLGVNDWESVTDEGLVETFLDSPVVAAPRDLIETMFELGIRQPAGAYQIGPFRLQVSGDQYWGAKLRDPATTYVDNLLSAIAYGCDAETKEKLLESAPTVRSFVWDVLNYPFHNGNRFRDELGNLADIAAARKAVLMWLQRNAVTGLSQEDLRHPARRLSQACLEAGRRLLGEWCSGRNLSQSPIERFENLVVLGLGAAAVDLNNPQFQKELAHHAGPGPWIDGFIHERIAKSLSPELGGNHFIKEFFETYVDSPRPSTIVFLSGNYAQAYLSLAICQEMLQQNRTLQLLFAPKSGAPGNDLGLEDAETALRTEAGSALAPLAACANAGRFVFVCDGPACHGLDPARLSSEMTDALARASAIVAEGQAYAEIRGWKKPTYVAFRVNGRVAEAIHGVSRNSGPCGFVRLTPGINHFEGFETAVLRNVRDPTTRTIIPAALQTTSEYVRAVLSENFLIIVRSVFHGDQYEACRQLRAEARRLGKTFADVLIGVGSQPPDPRAVRSYYDERHYPVFACGGGGGFNGVTLKALRMLGLPVVAGVPATDDGGSSGDLQAWLRQRRGFVFGVGDMAGILQDSLENNGKQAVLAYRLDREPTHLADAVLQRIKDEISRPTYPDSPIGSAPDFLSFVCNQLNLARIVDRSFRNGKGDEALRVKGASIRNLNLIAAYEVCGCLGDYNNGQSEGRLDALYVLEKALGAASRVTVLPVTYDECTLFLEYEDPVPSYIATAFRLPPSALQEAGHRLLGQCYIDTLPQDGKRRTAGVVVSTRETSRRPRANPEYLARLRKARLFIMGAGSLVSSQLAQLAVDGVLETLLERRDMRRILVINHVKMDETRGMTLRQHIELIETVATENAPPEQVERIAPVTKRLRISDIFSDVVIPRTVAREIEDAMVNRQYTWDRAGDKNPAFVRLQAAQTGQEVKVFRNRYVDFLLKYPDVQESLGITLREIEVLSYLEQPRSLYRTRTEAGRYRGALFATDEDVDYLIKQGIQLRNIHQVDSIGENWKLLKSEGTPSLEFFPGLVAEALMGIFRIALERGCDQVEHSSPA